MVIIYIDWFFRLKAIYYVRYSLCCWDKWILQIMISVRCLFAIFLKQVKFLSQFFSISLIIGRILSVIVLTAKVQAMKIIFCSLRQLAQTYLFLFLLKKYIVAYFDWRITWNYLSWFRIFALNKIANTNLWIKMTYV